MTETLKKTPEPRRFSIPSDAISRKIIGPIGSIIEQGILADIDKAKRSSKRTALFLLINSPGGSPEISIKLYEQLTEACDKGILSLTTYNLNETQSNAVCIYCAGQTRWCGNRANFLLHEAEFCLLGERLTATKIKQLQKEIPKLKKSNKRFVEIIASATHKSKEEVAEILCQETTYNYQTAYEHGLYHHLGLTASIQPPIEEIKEYKPID